jgi:hypothetical protein
MGTRRRVRHHRKRYRGGVEFTVIEGESEAAQEKRFKIWQKERQEEEEQREKKKENIEALRKRKVAPLGHLTAPTTVGQIRKISGKTGASRRTRRRRHTRRRR